MKICAFSGCGRPVFGGGFCLRHQYLRTDKKTKPKLFQRYNKKFDYDTSYGFHSETKMFKWILSTRGNRSFISRAEINCLGPINFAHVLPKGIGKYPHFRFNSKYVILVTEYEHYLIDYGTHVLRDKYAKEHPEVNWEKYYELEQQAKEEYEEKYGKQNFK